MAGDDWLDIEDEEQTAGLPVVIAVPTDITARVALLEKCWSRLSVRQKRFLTAFQEHGHNSRAAERAGGGARSAHQRWMRQPEYATVIQVWRSAAAQQALDKDRLLARQDRIVELALTPKPVLYQGELTGVEEIDVGVASRANEVLLDRAMPKPRADVEVNVGIAFTPVQVEVDESRELVDAEFEVVEAGPILPLEES